MEVLSIRAVAHKYRSSKKGIWIEILPDTGCTMAVIPLSMVERLDLKINMSDTQYELKNASGDLMEVLCTVIICLEPEGSDTREEYRRVTDELGDDQILLSSIDMLEWEFFSPNFSQVQKMKKEKLKKIEITAKKTRRK